jgi:hypothetical protein
MDSKYIYPDGNSYIVRNTEYEQKTKKFNFGKYASKEVAFVEARKWRDEQELRLQEIQASQLVIYRQTKLAKEKAEQRLWELDKEKREADEAERCKQQTKEYFAQLLDKKKELTVFEKWELANPHRLTPKVKESLCDMRIINSMCSYDKRNTTMEEIDKYIAFVEELEETKIDRENMTKQELIQWLFPSQAIVAVKR